MDAQTQSARSRADARIGRLLVEMGKITEEQLTQALREQESRERLGVRSSVGEICVERDWVRMRDIAIAMREQEQEVLRFSSLGQILLELKYIDPQELDRALEAHADLSAPIGEILVELGICTEDQVRTARELQSLQRHTATRRAVVSRYHPFNLMELVVNQDINDAIAERDGCFCRECWANVYAVAMNELPTRYVSDERLIPTFINLCRAEHEPLIRQQLEIAVDKVKARPKGACQGKLHHLELERLAAAGQGFADEVTVHVSNHHVHLVPEHQAALFGAGYELTKWKDLEQPGQYAAKEVVSLAGNKGRLDKVRILGPCRADTQVEISGTDQYILGIQAPVRDSGNLEGTPGIRLVGPAGEVTTARGVIRALRHIHMKPEDARRTSVKNADVVDVRLDGDRTTVCQGVLIRVTDKSALEMHIDTDEANAAGVASESVGHILGPSYPTHGG
jgi:putative phosphotransacetylase